VPDETPTDYRPPSTAARSWNFLLYGFLISIALHLILGPFFKAPHTQTEEETPQKVTVAKIPTPPPTPPPTPTPKPTPPPTPPPKETPPPKQTPSPQQPKIKIHTIKQTNTHTTNTELANQYTKGNTEGIPQGQGTAAPASAPPATPAPPPPPPTPKPLMCARPNVEATTVHAIEPDMPAMAQQQGITGDVTVVISLDENSHILSATVDSSPSKLLNAAALSAARQSTFQTEIRDCKPVAASYKFVVEFNSQ
jgi:TonB family protein